MLAYSVHKHVASVSNARHIQHTSVEVLTENMSIQNEAEVLYTHKQQQNN